MKTFYEYLNLLNEAVNETQTKNQIKNQLNKFFNQNSINNQIIKDQIVNNIFDCVNDQKIKGYFQWIINLIKNDYINIYFIDNNDNSIPIYVAKYRQATLPEDKHQIKSDLILFRNNNLGDINRIQNIRQLRNVLTPFYQTAKRIYIDNISGAIKIYEDNIYQLFKIPKLNGNDDESKINALKRLGIGSRWCTRSETDDNPNCIAENYLINVTVYVLRKNNLPYCQFDKNNFMDIDDISIDLKNNEELLQLFNIILNDFKVHNEEKIQLKFILKNKLNYDFSYDEFQIIINNAEYAYKYAKSFNQSWDDHTDYGRIALISIANSTEYAYEYAIHFKQPWDSDTELGRIALINIAKNVEYAYYYAENFKQPWEPDTEWGRIALMNIVRNAEYAYYYADSFNQPWDINIEWGQIALMSIANDGYYACNYAENFKQPWDGNTELGRVALMNIANDGYSACNYAIKFKQPWDNNTEWGRIALMSIANHSYYAHKYTKYFN